MRHLVVGLQAQHFGAAFFAKAAGRRPTFLDFSLFITTNWHFDDPGNTGPTFRGRQ